mmetsp:Transcript_43331/g.94373  ORF Transcript_43331/g.94373 Transcript_43331/m.94373 type:complete len:224 (-) Transcript_43331:837-1508(-)
MSVFQAPSGISVCVRHTFVEIVSSPTTEALPRCSSAPGELFAKVAWDKASWADVSDDEDGDDIFGLSLVDVDKRLAMLEVQADQDTPEVAVCVAEPLPSPAKRGRRAEPVAFWRKLCMAARETTHPGPDRRWLRLASKLVARETAAAPMQGSKPTSVGSLPHALGKPCRPCTFYNKKQGCYDGVLCQFCHFDDNHGGDCCRGRKSKSRRQRKARQERCAADLD